MENQIVNNCPSNTLEKFQRTGRSHAAALFVQFSSK